MLVMNNWEVCDMCWMDTMKSLNLCVMCSMLSSVVHIVMCWRVRLWVNSVVSLCVMSDNWMVSSVMYWLMMSLVGGMVSSLVVKRSVVYNLVLWSYVMWSSMVNWLVVNSGMVHWIMMRCVNWNGVWHQVVSRSMC